MKKDIPKIGDLLLQVDLVHHNGRPDIFKIGRKYTDEQIENLRIINLLKENLKIPFLFLAGGECRILRRIGGSLGCCMYLCVHEYDELATKSQPLLRDMKILRELL